MGDEIQTPVVYIGIIQNAMILRILISNHSEVMCVISEFTPVFVGLLWGKFILPVFRIPEPEGNQDFMIHVTVVCGLKVAV